MTDREKTLSGLEHCSEDGCKGCPYEQDCKMCDGFSLLAKDALELLKPKKPGIINGLRYYTCGSCGNGLWVAGQKYCACCGTEVGWDALFG